MLQADNFSIPLIVNISQFRHQFIERRASGFILANRFQIIVELYR